MQDKEGNSPLFYIDLIFFNDKIIMKNTIWCNYNAKA